MAIVAQIEPVTSLQKGYQAVFSKLDNGPVVLTNRGSATAVLQSVDEFNRRETRLAQLERWILASERLADMEAGNYVTEEEFLEGLKRRGIE